MPLQRVRRVSRPLPFHPLDEIDLEVPENLRAMIEAQIQRLNAEEQRALEQAREKTATRCLQLWCRAPGQSSAVIGV